MLLQLKRTLSHLKASPENHLELGQKIKLETKDAIFFFFLRFNLLETTMQVGYNGQSYPSCTEEGAWPGHRVRPSFRQYCSGALQLHWQLPKTGSHWAPREVQCSSLVQCRSAVQMCSAVNLPHQKKLSSFYLVATLERIQNFGYSLAHLLCFPLLCSFSAKRFPEI